MAQKILNIAYFLPYASRNYGGPFTYITELSPALKKFNVSVTLYSSNIITNFPKTITLNRVQYANNLVIKRHFASLYFNQYFIGFDIIPILNKDMNDIDLFHSHGIRSFQEDIGYLLNKIKKKPFIITPHGALDVSANYFNYLVKNIHDRFFLDIINNVIHFS